MWVEPDAGCAHTGGLPASGLTAARDREPAMADMSREELLDSLREKRKSFQHKDFSGLDLRGIDLQRLDFTGAKFVGARLAGNRMTEANFTRADFREADLAGCRLLGSTLTSASLARANLVEADLTGAVMPKAAARSRSMSTVTWGLLICKSLVTSINPGRARIFSSRMGA